MALHDNGHAGALGHYRASVHRDLTGGEPRPVMPAEHPLHRKTPEQAVGEHRAGAAIPLLGRLKDQVDGAGPIVRLPQQRRGAEQAGRVPVMPAGMHDPTRHGGVGHARLFVDRQRVHVGA